MIVTTILFIFLIFVFVAFVWVFQLWKSRRMRRLIAHFPGPPAVPFLGNSLEFLGSNKDIMNSLLTLPQRYSTPFRMLMGSTVYIVTTNPSDLQVLCNSSKALSKPAEYDYLKPLLRNGLFTASGPVWKKHRRLILPTFNQKILNSFVQIFTKQAEILVQQLKKEVGSGTFDAFSYLCPFTVDSICAFVQYRKVQANGFANFLKISMLSETTMGVQVNAQIEESPFLFWVNRALEIGFKRIFHIWLRIELIFKLTPYAKQEKEVIEKTQRFVDNIIKQKKKEYMEQHQRDHESDLPELDDEPKFLSTLNVLLNLLSNDSGFTDEKLRDEVTTIVMAGSDTTAVSLGFILIMLAMHPDHQEKVYEEVIDVLGPDGTLHHEDLKKLPYTERVIKETMRIYPPGPLIARLVDEDIHLQSYSVPAGSAFVVHIIAMHRDARLYPDPLKFEPDRFLPEEVAKRHPYSWIPFGAGPRNCIGMTYAMMQVKTTTAYLIRKYKFTTEYKSIEDLELKADLLIKPVHGHLISIELRE